MPTIETLNQQFFQATKSKGSGELNNRFCNRQEIGFIITIYYFNILLYSAIAYI